jgi:hypothetical protein
MKKKKKNGATKIKIEDIIVHVKVFWQRRISHDENILNIQVPLSVNFYTKKTHSNDVGAKNFSYAL